jgi:hypothetical protein
MCEERCSSLIRGERHAAYAAMGLGGSDSNDAADRQVQGVLADRRLLGMDEDQSHQAVLERIAVSHVQRRCPSATPGHPRQAIGTARPRLGERQSEGLLENGCQRASLAHRPFSGLAHQGVIKVEIGEGPIADRLDPPIPG